MIRSFVLSVVSGRYDSRSTADPAGSLLWVPTGPKKPTFPEGSTGRTLTRVDETTETSTGSSTTASTGDDSKETWALATTRPGAISPTSSTDPSMTPRAWTQPDPLLWAIAAHASTVKMQPAIGPTA